MSKCVEVMLFRYTCINTKSFINSFLYRNKKGLNCMKAVHAGMSVLLVFK